MKKLISLIFLLTVALGFSQNLKLGFETGETGAPSGVFGNMANPVIETGTGTNTSKVLKIVCNTAGEVWQGSNFNLTNTVTLTTNQTMTIDVLASGPMFFLVKVNGGVSGAPEAAAVVSYTGTNTWQTCSFTFNSVRDSKAAAANGTYASFVIHPYWESAAQINFGTLRPARTLWVDNFALPTSVPALTTTPATAITNTTATINGNISSNGGANITSYGFYWSTTPGFDSGTVTQVEKGTTNFTGAISHNLTGLTTSTIYYYKAYATNSIGTTYGAQQSFTAITAPTLGSFTVPAKLTSDVPFALTAPTSNSAGAFTYNSSNTAVATISGSTITIVGVGTSIITATQAANGAYGLGSTTASFVVSAPSMQAAPIPPCRDVSDVVVSYNDAPYPGRPNTISTTGNNWGANGVITENSNGGSNNIKLITNSEYGQIAFSPTTAAAAMTFLHVDIYSTTASASRVKVYVNAQTGYYPTPNGVWKSLDIPVSSLGGFATVSLVKILLDAPGTFYVDNIYFYRVPATPTFTQVPTVCSGATMTALPTTSNNGINGTWSPALNNMATTLYTFTTSGTCPNTTTMTITVNPVINPSVSIAVSPSTTVCAGTSVTFTATPTNGGASPSYQWQVNGSDVGTNSATYTSTTLANNAVVRVVMTSNATCATGSPATSNTVTMTVNARPTSVVSGTATTCDGTAKIISVALTGTGPWNLTYTDGTTPISITAIDSSPYTFNVTPTSTKTYTVTALSDSKCTAIVADMTGSAVVTVNARPTTSVITGSASFCVNSTGNVYSVINTAGSTYSWTLPPGAIITAGSFSNSITVTFGTTTGNVAVTETNAANCLGTQVTKPVTVNTVENIWTAAEWSNGTPTSDQKIVFSENYNTNVASISANLIACSCQVNSGTVTIGSGNTMTLTNSLTVSGGSLTFEDSASLVQINDVPNIGDITYNRQTTQITKMDYTYWSTPVLPFTLGEVSPYTSGDKMYSFDSNIDNWKQESPATSMVPGVGYIIRGPQNFIPPFPPSTYIAPFVGVPNNGDYDIKGIVAGRSYLLGNPYPSALDADAFLVANQNVLNGTLYFWTHNTPIAIGTPNPGSGVYAYSGNDYAAYNATGGVATINPPDIDPNTGQPYPSQAPSGIPEINNYNIPTGKIASGQGFFGSSKDPLPSTPIIIFDNTMRVGVIDITKEDNSQFFKTKNPKAKTNIQLEKHRIWLDLTNSQGAFKQTLVGYVTDATNGYEDRFDGESYDGNDFLDFYSINEEKNLTIQGRAVPFDENDEIPLGYRIALGGSFTISIDETDGLLTNQAVYLEDKATNTIFNLKNGNYTFTTDKGTFNDRFVLRYTDKTLGTVAVEKPANQILVTIQNKQIKITSLAEPIEKVLVYDVSGKQRYQKRNVNNTELLITTLAPSHQILLVKTVLQNGKSSTKKVLF